MCAAVAYESPWALPFSDRLDVQILKVVDPSHFIVRETCGVNMSQESMDFWRMEQQMNDHFEKQDVMPLCPIPVSKGMNAIVYVRQKRKWFRCRIDNLLESACGITVCAYLLDYGETVTVTRDFIRKSDGWFHLPPNAVMFELIGLMPKSKRLALSNGDVKVEDVHVTKWDQSSLIFIKNLIKNRCIKVSVKAVDNERNAYGLMYIHSAGEEKCVNDILLEEGFAYLSDEKAKQAIFGSQLEEVEPVREDSETNELQKELKDLRHALENKTYNQQEFEHNQIFHPPSLQTLSSVLEGDMSLQRDVPPNLLLETRSWHSLSSSGSQTTSRSTSPRQLTPRLSKSPQSPALPGSAVGLPNTNSSSRLVDPQNLPQDRLESGDTPCVSPSPKMVKSPRPPKNRMSYRSVLAALDKHSGDGKDKSTACSSSSSQANEAVGCSRNFKHDVLKYSNDETQNQVAESTSRCVQQKSAQDSPEASSSSTPKLTKAEYALTPLKNPRGRSQEENVAGYPSFSMASCDLGQSYNRRRSLTQSSVNDLDDEGMIGDLGSAKDECRIETVPPEPEKLPVITFDRLSPSFKAPSFNRRSDLTKDMGTVIDDNIPYANAVCHGMLIPKPIRRIHHAPLSEAMMMRLKQIQFNELSNIQTVAWLAMFRKRNSVLVAPPHSGKTFAYLIPLLSTLEQLVNCTDFPKGKSPRALILCSSWKNARVVFEQCQLVLGEHETLKPMIVHGGGHEDGHEDVQMRQLVNGCDILVTTPCCMQRIIEYWRDTFNILACVCHIILDDGEVLLEKFPEQIQGILKEYTSAVQHQVQSATAGAYSQIVVCSPTWTARIESFARYYMASPLVFLTSFYEATVYARVPCYVHYQTKDQTSMALHSLLDQCREHKVVLCVSKAEDAIELQAVISSLAMVCLVVHENMSHHEIQDVSQKWHKWASNTPVVLIASDDALLYLNIRNATFLIHYDIPSGSRSQFGNRFSVLSDHFSKILSIPKDSGMASRCVSHMFVSPECKRQALYLVDFLERLNSSVPVPLKKLAELSKKEREDPAKHELCAFVKSMGKCPKEKFCFYRHTIHAEVDEPNLPWKGLVRVLVTHVVDAVKYWVRVVEFKNEETEPWTPADSEFKKMKIKMESYFSNKNNLKPPAKVHPSQILAAENGNSFSRVQVRKVFPNSFRSICDKVLVWFIDEGHTKLIHRITLSLLPEELTEIPHQAIQMHLCNVCPIDKDVSWTIQAGTFVDTLIGGRVLTGKVVLCLSNTLFVKPLVMQKSLKTLNTSVNTFNVAKKLISSGYAVENPDHLKLLHELCKDKIEIPDMKIGSKPAKKEVSVPLVKDAAHAFLEVEADAELVLVQIVLAPDLFYVQKISSHSCLNNLEKEANEMFQKGELRHPEEIVEGMLCLAPLIQDEKSLFRAAVRNYNEGEGTVTLFYVDYGDSATLSTSCIYEIPQKLLQQLPLQAIECSLADVSPLGDSWNEEAADVLADFTRDSTDQVKLMLVECVCKIPSRTTCGNGYKVHLFDRETQRSAVEELQQSKLAAVSDVQTTNEAAEAYENDTGNGSSATPSETHVEDDECSRLFLEEVFKGLHQQQQPDNSPRTGTYDSVSDASSDVEPPHQQPNNCTDVSEEPQTSTTANSEEIVPSSSPAPPLEALPNCQNKENKAEATCSQSIVQKKKEYRTHYRATCILKALAKYNQGPNDSSSSQTPSTQTEETAKESSPAPIEMPTDVNVKTPQIKWWQKKKMVTVSVNVTDAKDCRVSFTPTHITFSSNSNGQAYYFHERLFAEICPDASRYNARYSHVSINMQKKNVGEKWPYLFFGKKKANHVKPDFDHIGTSSDDDSDEDKAKQLNCEPRPVQSGNILPFDPYESEKTNEDSDDDDDELNDNFFN